LICSPFFVPRSTYHSRRFWHCQRCCCSLEHDVLCWLAQYQNLQNWRDSIATNLKSVIRQGWLSWGPALPRNKPSYASNRRPRNSALQSELCFHATLTPIWCAVLNDRRIYQGGVRCGVCGAAKFLIIATALAKRKPHIQSNCLHGSYRTASGADPQQTIMLWPLLSHNRSQASSSSSSYSTSTSTSTAEAFVARHSSCCSGRCINGSS
jgi:hypothetical protein